MEKHSECLSFECKIDTGDMQMRSRTAKQLLLLTMSESQWQTHPHHHFGRRSPTVKGRIRTNLNFSPTCDLYIFLPGE